MNEESKAGKAGVALAGVALVTAAVALAQKPRAAQAAANAVTLDEATMNLLVAIASTGGDISGILNQIAGSLGNQGGEGGPISLQVQGYPPNADTILANRVMITALNQAFELPVIIVPDDMELQIKGWPTNAGLIYVGATRSEVTNVNQIWPLLANEAIGYRIKNTYKRIYVAGTVVGDSCVVTVEQRR